MEIVTRADAQERGLTRYFTGKPCKNGHVSERYVLQSKCVECIRARNQAKYASDPAKHKAAAAARLEKKRDAVRLQQAEYRSKNREKLRLKTAEWRRKNPEVRRASDAKYRAANKAKQRENHRDWERRAIADDSLYALKKRVRCLVKDAAARRGHRKGEKTEAILGCDWQFFRLNGLRCGIWSFMVSTFRVELLLLNNHVRDATYASYFPLVAAACAHRINADGSALVVVVCVFWHHAFINSKPNPATRPRLAQMERLTTAFRTNGLTPLPTKRKMAHLYPLLSTRFSVF